MLKENKEIIIKHLAKNVNTNTTYLLSNSFNSLKNMLL